MVLKPPDPSSPIAIAVAPNGGRRSKADHPALPITIDELAATAAGCVEVGAAMIHLHVRDAQGRHLLDAETYRRTITAIQKVAGDRLVIQITSESIGKYSPTEQMAVIRAVHPEAVSVGLRELVPDAGSEAGFAAFLAWLAHERITPQIILYSPGEAVRLGELMQRGLIPWKKVPVLFVLGSYVSPRDSEPTDLIPFVSPPVPKFENWMICAFGRHEQACLAAAARSGGHVRVGFENNLYRPDGSRAPDNASQVQGLAEHLRSAGVALMNADQLRAVWAGL